MLKVDCILIVFETIWNLQIYRNYIFFYFFDKYKCLLTSFCTIISKLFYYALYCYFMKFLLLLNKSDINKFLSELPLSLFPFLLTYQYYNVSYSLCI